MVRIRLARAGARNRPFFHVVVSDGRNGRDGRFIERVGFYNPIARADEEKFRIRHERVDYWLSHGAQASERVARLIKQSARAAADHSA